MLEIFIAKPNLSQDEFACLLMHISSEKRDRINRYNFFRDAQNTLIGDILVRSAIYKRTGLSNSRQIFSANEYGKPYLVNDPQIHFNISHAGNFVAAVIDDKAVGVDIELISPIDLKIAERFFAADERDYIFSRSAEWQQRAFFEVWTKKESRIKWEGIGLSKPLPSFSVFDQGDDDPHYHCIFEDNDAICHVCTIRKDEIKCNMIKIEDLLYFAADAYFLQH